jgi:cold shock CspA family protein
MHLGRIKCFFHGRGYGFIEDHEGREVYFSLSVVERGPAAIINSGDTVYFEVISTGLGLEALRVRVA